LIDSGDGAGGELGKFSVNFGSCGLCNPARSFGEWSINVKAARVDPGVECPQRLFRGG
jgi:hypothetical protein